MVSCREAADADSSTPTKSQVSVDYFIIPYTLHLLHCLMCIRNAMSIVLLLETMKGMGYLGDGPFLLGCGWEDRGCVSSYSFLGFFRVLLYFVFLFPSRFWLVHGDCCVCFFVFSLFSLPLVPLTRSY